MRQAMVKILSGDLKINRQTIIFASLLVALGVIFRVIPHPANFAPIGAIALMGGATIKGKFSLFIPLTAIVLSDLVIGLHDTILFTWGAFALIALLSSRYLSSRLNSESLLLGAFGSAILFFIISNIGVWLVGGLYELNATGLWQCFANALPFLRNTILSDISYSYMFFGIYVFATNYLPHAPLLVNRHKA